MKHCPLFRRVPLKPLTSLLLLAVSGQAYSDCTPVQVNTAEQVISFRTISILKPISSGAEIGYNNSTFPRVITGCESAPNWNNAQVHMRGVKNPTGTWDFNGVYPTGVPGIGYTVTSMYSGRGGAAKMTTGPSSAGVLVDFYQSFQGVNLSHQVVLRATSNINPGTYKIPRQVIALYRSRPFNATSIDGSPGASSNLVLDEISVIVKNQTCDLAAGDTNRTITLDPVKRSEFVGQSAGKKQFEISANCTDRGNVTFRFSGTPVTGDAWRFANTGTAKGINVWLYSRIAGTEQTITANGDNNSRTIAISNGKAVLPLGVAYFNQTAGSVNAGTVASTATVNITYD
ncbi:fimbrial protein [Pseudomonas sp. KCJK9016]|uniref:fimbrial protein n=1 Tax=Pseudomonas sp. KCJK9016 TaxID=3344556 RepID=UPI003905B31F